ncbi:DUF1611 domain-containing protein [Pacificimonas sp. WHA3]|uniref:DUF1611 domain-containing protein n=1 Tax=Pacificimonas pallii TaxID=2827236 RepID=A0ABS6SBK3_9SPHN|nr:DUF1611 domain-containing protein [Pacificimonas pallii]MBV7255311.1 DUF1611 domain-containing protein [Pacificimonas pallii]
MAHANSQVLDVEGSTNGFVRTLPELRTPFLIFLGDVQSNVLAKTGMGVHHWRPERCLGQLRLDGCKADLGLPDMTVAKAVEAGAGSLLLGAAPDGGRIYDHWLPVLREALKHGLDIVSGFHTKLADNPELVALARENRTKLIDVRVPPDAIPVATGRRRSGKRLLTVGTDCAVGKKYTALALEKGLQQREIDAQFRATGQTGILIAGRGIPMDSVVSDFLSGAAEQLTPDRAPDHWDIIEGQGSLYHPAYAAVSLGLLHGSQPDVIVLCHDVARATIDDYPDFPIPDLGACVSRYLSLARLTNPDVRCAGISLNTSSLDECEKREAVRQVSLATGLPCCDPVAHGVDILIDSILLDR